MPCSEAALRPDWWGTHGRGDPGRLHTRNHIGIVLFSQPSGEPVDMDARKPLAPWGDPRPQVGLALGDVWAMLERQDGRGLWLETQTREQGSYELLKK